MKTSVLFVLTILCVCVLTPPSGAWSTEGKKDAAVVTLKREFSKIDDSLKLLKLMKLMKLMASKKET